MSYAKALARQTFSTKSFVPGHVAGAAILLFGTIAVAKAFIGRHEADVRAHERGQYNKRRDQLARRP
jgi:hypothetical protein